MGRIFGRPSSVMFSNQTSGVNRTAGKFMGITRVALDRSAPPYPGQQMSPAGRRTGVVRWLAMCLVFGCAFRSVATELVLESGMTLSGRLGPRIGSVAENALSGGPREGTQGPIVFVDDGLRRSFVCWRLVQQAIPDESGLEKIRIEQAVSRGGAPLAGIGDVVRASDFDEYGRRAVSLITGRGTINLVQGITEITPVYTRVEALAGTKAYLWDMRMATSSLPRSTLYQVLTKQHREDVPDGHLATVRLLLSSRRYGEARLELEKAIERFPQLQELDDLRLQLHTQAAEQLLNEIQLRREAGRVQQARRMLSEFPVTEDTAAEIMLQVRDMLDADRRAQQQVKRVLDLVKTHRKTLEDPELSEVVKLFQLELQQHLSPNTLDTMADYLRLSDDESLAGPQKLALALGGWLLGSGVEGTTLNRIASMWEGRELVRKYIGSQDDADQVNREAGLSRLLELEGTSPGNVARLLARMVPPLPLRSPAQEVPGLFRVTVASKQGLEPVHYWIQLPPEYDPYRKYPTIVTLHRIGSTPVHQIRWWAGEYSEKHEERLGQATRHGYVVIAPEWANATQQHYGYSGQEHHAVLASLRDAFRRVSIDTDRVFLSGHSSGGDAAWDLALAHPDLWAGVIPIVASAQRKSKSAPGYVNHYWKNTEKLPMFFVCGEMDGDRMTRNSATLDRCLQAGYDVLVSEFRGRGHEMFGDEIQRLMQWMQLYRRDFYPTKFEMRSLRHWDNFFWCVDVRGFSDSMMVMPLEWRRRKAGVKATTSVSIQNDVVRVTSSATDITLSLSPQLVDFSAPLRIVIDGRAIREPVVPDVRTMLEDVRRRADRQNPFWASVRVVTGRRP